MSAAAWAVIDGGLIFVRTVSDTRRAAIVNWLVAEAGLPVFNWMTDDVIEDMWRRSTIGTKARIVEVEVLYG